MAYLLALAPRLASGKPDNLRRELGTSSCPVLDSACQKDVFIIGAGMSGVSAARELLTKSSLTHAWAEARDEIGGRMRLSEDALCSLDPGEELCWNLEDGANWITGGEGNPVFDLAWEYNLEHWRMNWESLTFWDISTTGVSTKIQKMQLPWDGFQAGFDCAIAKSHECDADSSATGCELSVREYMDQECDFLPADAVERAVEFYSMDWEYTVPPSLIGLIGMMVFNGDFQGKDHIVDDERGFKHIAEQHKLGDDPCFSTTVTSVARSGDSNYPVRVSAEYDNGSGKTTESCDVKTVISTLPVGVLLHDTNLFNIDGMDSFLMDLDEHYGVGLFYKIFFIFKEKFWEDTEVMLLASEAGESITSGCVAWVNKSPKKNSHYFAKSNIIMCNIMTDAVEAITGGTGLLSDADVDDLLDDLRQIYGVTLVKGVDYEYHYHPWMTDPHARGSYVYPKPGANRASFDAAIAPLVDGDDTLVRWAGAHACYRHFEYTHGALARGQAVAWEVINDLCDSCEDIDATTICDEAPPGGLGNPQKVRGNS